ENLEQAISAYQAALTVRTHDAFPEDWAVTQWNLGAAYHERLRGDPTENLQQAIAAYQAALTILTRDMFPSYHLETQLNLALAFERQRRWGDAHDAYAAARAVQADLLALAADAESLAATIAKRARRNMYLADAFVLLQSPEPDLAAVAAVLEEGRA